ncbi:MAG: Uma2 family endonuclease [Chloroflexi bacterium]|nr:Uma2 family endonuclease [Chloroflexota bacterium]
MTTGDTALYTPTPARQPPAKKMSFEEFHDWLDEDTWAEWVGGEVQMVSPASLRHADMATFLAAVLRPWVEMYDLGLLLTAPFLMRLPPPVDRAREPDLLFIAREHRDRLHPTYLEGPADLVVEITSPESIGRDRGEKFVEYEQAGVREYWLIDPDRRHAEFYQLGPDGRYRVALAGAAGEYVSPTLSGLKLPVDWLWRDPLPKVAEALRTLGVIG